MRPGSARTEALSHVTSENELAGGEGDFLARLRGTLHPAGQRAKLGQLCVCFVHTVGVGQRKQVFA